MSFDPNSCIGSVGLGWTLEHYFTTSVTFGEGLHKSNLKTNGDIKKEIERGKNEPNVGGVIKADVNIFQLALGW